jgi:ABC-type branched-subunit amino acid transport system substrate-binding protein
MTDTPTLSAPTFRSTYGVLLGVGAAVLSVGLALPFVVATTPVQQAGSSSSLAGGAAGSGLSGTTGGLTAAGTSGGGATGTGPGTTGSGTTGTGGASTLGGTSGSGGTGTGAGGTAAPLNQRKASDIGITPASIKLGILIPSDNSKTAGGADFSNVLGSPMKQWKAFVDDANKRGGILGRTITPVFKEYDGLSLDAQRAACVYLTEQEKVFAIVNSGGFYGDPILCVTQQHKTPFIGQAGEALDYYQKSNGLYFSTTPNKDRVLRNLVRAALADGVFKGKTVGILSREGIDAIPVDRSLKPELAAAGIKVKYEARISSDDSAAQSQIPVEVQQMRSNGVDLIMLETGLIVANVFVQQADSQRYYPQYLTSDFASGGADIYTIGMPASFAGSITYTALRTGEARAGMPEFAPDAACRKVYEKATGATLDHKTTEYSLTVTACGIMNEFVAGMRTAGVNPTRTLLSQALQGIGRWSVPYSGDGSWGPNKFDAPDVVRRASWHADCKCWLPVGPFRRTSY